MTSSIDPTKPETGAAETLNVRNNFQAAHDEIETLQGLSTPNVTDSATSKRMTLGDATIELGTTGAGSSYAITHPDDLGSTVISGGTAAQVGASIQLYGDTHATKAKDIEVRSGGSDILTYDDSTFVWTFRGAPVVIQQHLTVGAGLTVTGRTTLNTDFTINSIPTSSGGLQSGDVWSDSGTLKIVS